MESNLIYDVGLHTGEDTDFYLKKGFRVCAVEANPVLVESAEKRFRPELDVGQLVIISKAIAANEGSVRFAVNSRDAEWGTIDANYARRNESVGTSNTWIEVPATTIESILAIHGTPYYMKVDIEGADYLCIDGLAAVSDKPVFVSVEITFFSFEDYFSMLAKLWVYGYRRFKLINQANIRNQVCPSPPREGNYIDHKFAKGSSGLFGIETPGKWLDIETTLKQVNLLAGLMKRHSPLFGSIKDTQYSRAIRYYYAKVRREPIAWYDLHATF